MPTCLGKAQARPGEDSASCTVRQQTPHRPSDGGAFFGKTPRPARPRAPSPQPPPGGPAITARPPQTRTQGKPLGLGDGYQADGGVVTDALQVAEQQLLHGALLKLAGQGLRPDELQQVQRHFRQVESELCQPPPQRRVDVLYLGAPETQSGRGQAPRPPRPVLPSAPRPSPQPNNARVPQSLPPGGHQPHSSTLSRFAFSRVSCPWADGMCSLRRCSLA